MSDGQIQIDIIADIQRFKSSLSELGSIAKSEMGGLSGVLQSTGDRISSIGGAMTAGFTVPLAAASAVAGKFAFDTVAAAEQASIAFETMLGPEKAKSMLEDLADFAANTPFELVGLESSTQKLIAMGFEAEECIPLLTSIGDAASGLGAGQAGIDQITRALGQMNAKGKVQAEEMLQLTEIGIPAWQYLADAISNGDIPAAMEMVTKGAVDSKTAISALQDGMDRDFGGMMSKQAQTLTGVLSNMADAVQKPLMAVKDTKGYQELTQAFSRLTDSVEPFISSLLPHLEKGLSRAADVIDVVTGLLDSFTQADEEAQAGILNLILALAGTGPGLMVLGKGMSAAGSVIELFNKQITTADGKTTTYGEKIKGVASSMGAAKSVALGLGAAFAAVIATIVIQKAAELAEYYADLNTATSGLTTAQQNAKAAFDDTNEAISNGPSALSLYRDSVSETIESSANLAQSIRDDWNEFYANEELLSGYIDTISQLAGQSGLTAQEQTKLKTAVEGYNQITGDTVEVTDAAKGSLSKATQEIKDNAQAWLDNAEAQAYQEKILDLQKQQIDNEQAISDAKKANQEAWDRYNEAVDRGETSLDGYKAAIDDTQAKLNEAQSVWNSTESTISSYSDKMSEAEQSMLSYIGTNQTLIGMINSAGLNVNEVASAFESLGISQDYLANATPQQLSNIVGSYEQLKNANISIDTVKQAMSDLGISQQMLADMTPDQVTNLMTAYSQLSGAGINMQGMKTAMDEIGLSQQELANLTPGQIQQIVDAYSGGQVSIDQICQAIKNGTIDQLGQAGTQGGSSFSSGINSQSSNAYSAGANIANQAESGASTADGWSLGDDFAGGFIGAIGSRLGDVFNAAFNFAQNAAAGLQKGQDSASPSKVTAKLGKDFVAGYANAISQATEPYKAAKSMAEDTANGLKDSATSISRNAASLSMAMTQAMERSNITVPINAVVSNIAIPESALSSIAQVTSASIIGGFTAENKANQDSILIRIANGIDTTNNKLDALTSRVNNLESNVIRAMGSPVQIKYNKREFGRLVREVS